MRVYFDGLRDLELEWVVAAAERLQATAAWFPKVGDWRAMAVKVEAERIEAHRAWLRRLPAPACACCADTGWARDAGDRARPCACRTERRAEVLGRRPWPALPSASEAPDESRRDGDGGDAA